MQPKPDKASRTFKDYDSVDKAIDGEAQGCRSTISQQAMSRGATADHVSHVSDKGRPIAALCTALRWAVSAV